MRKYWFGSVIIALLMVSGCGGQKRIDTSNTAIADIVADANIQKKIFEEQQQNQYPYRDEAVLIPKDAIWLGDVRKAHFQVGDAKTLIRALANPHPVRFEVEEADNPIVYPPPGAFILKDYFDSIAVQCNWSYTVHKGVLVFRDWESRKIQLSALVGKATALLSKTSAKASGISEQRNELSIETDAYSEIEKLVAEILRMNANTSQPQQPQIQYTTEEVRTEDDIVVPDFEPAQVYPEQREVPDQRVATFTVSRAANMLFLSAKPNQIRDVVTALEGYNSSVSKRVVIDVTVYEVLLSNGDKRSLDLNLLRAATNTLISVSSADALTIARASSTAVQARNQTIIFNWIEAQGTVSKRLHRRFETLNNHAVTFLDTEEIEYVKKVTLERGGSGNSSSVSHEVVIGTHQLGRSFYLFATIVDGRVNIQMTINDRRIGERENYSLANGGGGTLFNIVNIDKVIPLSLSDGETRVLTYFEGDSTQTNHTRNRIIPGLLDGKNDSKERSETVIVVSADIID